MDITGKHKLKSFKDVAAMLNNYKQEPSIRLCNAIAWSLYPYMIKVSREYVFFNKHYTTHEPAFVTIDDLVNQLYIAIVPCIQKSIDHPHPVAYLLSSIKHLCRHIIITEHKKPYGMTECWNSKFDTLHIDLVDNLALGLVWNRGLEEEEGYKIVYDAILNLPITYKLVALLKYVYGYSATDVARKLKLSKGTVSRHLKSAEKLLAQSLKDEVDLSLKDRGKLALKNEVKRLKAMGISLYFLKCRYGLTNGQLSRLLYQ